MILELLERRTIQVRNKNGIKSKVAWIVGDFGVFQSNDGYWLMVHLPSGLTSGCVYKAAEDAAEAAQEISALKNTWAYATTEDFINLQDKIEIIENKHQGKFVNFLPQTPVNNLNGYAEAPTE